MNYKMPRCNSKAQRSGHVGIKAAKEAPTYPAPSLHTQAADKLNATSAADPNVSADGVSQAYCPSEGMQVLYAA